MSPETLKTIDAVSQVFIGIFSLLAIFLVGRKNKWGFVCGLLQQPFWFTTTILNGQWIIVALNVVFTLTWTYGFYEWWIKKKPKPKQ